MSGRVQGPARSSRSARFWSVFAALTAGGLVFGSVAVALGAAFLPVLVLALLFAAALALAVTR